MLKLKYGENQNQEGRNGTAGKSGIPVLVMYLKDKCAHQKYTFPVLCSAKKHKFLEKTLVTQVTMRLRKMPIG